MTRTLGVHVPSPPVTVSDESTRKTAFWPDESTPRKISTGAASVGSIVSLEIER